MCGRYTLTDDVEAIAAVFDADVDSVRDTYRPRYNIAPTQEAPVVVAASDTRRAGLLRWGLVPHWAEDPSDGAKLINARSETVHERPSFRDSFLARRCLVPADGFYEWEDAGGWKRPHWIHRPSEALFGFAGIWARWGGDKATPIHTFSILTRAAPESLAWLHDRVPVILAPETWDDWLARGTAPETLREILDAAAPPPLDSHPVSRRVNRADYDAPDCTEETDEEPPAQPQMSLF